MELVTGFSLASKEIKINPHLVGVRLLVVPSLAMATHITRHQKVVELVTGFSLVRVFRE